MGQFQEKYKALEKEISEKIWKKIEHKGVKSKHSDGFVMKLKEEQMFNLDGGRWAIEIGETILIDNNGYQYNHSVLTLEQLCEIVDNI